MTDATLLGRLRIRIGTPDDAERCQQIARQWRDELPFVMLPALREAAARKQLFIADVDGQIAGFVHWYARKDGINTIHEITVDRDHLQGGIGRALLYSVPCPIRLKCKADNDRANRFYANAGMQQEGTETTRKGTPLIIWRLNILAELVRGKDRMAPAVSRRSGMAYGVRHTDAPHDWPFAVDIHWRDYDWTDYMAKIRAWKPVQALVADYEHPSQRRQMYRQIRDLRAAGVLRVLVCPKFDGAVAHIPSWCVVAVSVPSTYAGFMPALSELRGRRVHLLGGTPVKWFGQGGRKRDMSSTGYIAAITGAGGKVISADGNGHVKVAQKGTYWLDGRWIAARDNTPPMELAIFSGRNIVKQLNEFAAYQQPKLALEWGRG